MIHEIYASDEGFKKIKFKKGLNLIIGISENESRNKNTINGVGKTSVLEIIHFCLGSDFKKGNYLKKIKKIENWTFYIVIDLFGEKITASRAINKHNDIFIEGNIDNFPLKPRKDKKGNPFYKLNEWKEILGEGLFGIEKYPPFSPTFNSLFSYFVRKKPESYFDPFFHGKNQQVWDMQVNTAFLLGLNWNCATKAQKLRAEKSYLDKKLNKINEEFPDQGDMEAEKLNLEQDYNKKSKELSEYKVHYQYKELQKDANEFSEKINKLSNENMILRRKCDNYSKSTQNEKTQKNNGLEKLYSEMGIVFPENIQKTLNDARIFHEKIIENRKNFLNVEIVRIKNQVRNNEIELNKYDKKRSKLLKILNTHKALDDFKLLQEQLYSTKIKIEKIKNNIAKFIDIDNEKDKNKEKKLLLKEEIKREYEDRRAYWEYSSRIFLENSIKLYGESGKLIINTSEKGYSYEIDFPKSDSRGVGKMKIFCYDWMLLESNLHNFKMNFLIHDSEIFDGVDPKKTALALILSMKKCIELNIQYIFTINYDAIPKKHLPDDFDIEEHTCLTLKDKKPEDHLFGFIF